MDYRADYDDAGRGVTGEKTCIAVDKQACEIAGGTDALIRYIPSQPKGMPPPSALKSFDRRGEVKYFPVAVSIAFTAFTRQTGFSDENYGHTGGVT